MNTFETIAIFSPSLQIGGAEQVVVNLANGFSRHGKSVALLLANADGPLRSKLDASVKVVDFYKSGVFGALKPLARFLSENSPDILFSAQSHANIIALLAYRLAGVQLPVVISEHTTMSLHFNLEPGIKNRFIPKLARLLYRQAHAVACISQGVADDILAVTKIAPGRVHRIYNPVLPPLTELQQKIEAPVEHPWFLPDALPVILAVGRLTAAKDYPTLLRAFVQVRQERNANLLILGDGEKRTKLENLINELSLTHSVQLPGFVENPYAYMSRCSLFVLSSAWEGLSNVLVEALACGASIVSTDCKNGPAEILENGRHGVLVPVGDSSALAEAILANISNRTDRASLRQRALDFSLDTITQQYLDLFTTVYREVNTPSTCGGIGILRVL